MRVETSFFSVSTPFSVVWTFSSAALPSALLALAAPLSRAVSEASAEGLVSAFAPSSRASARGASESAGEGRALSSPPSATMLSASRTAPFSVSCTAPFSVSCTVRRRLREGFSAGASRFSSAAFGAVSVPAVSPLRLALRAAFHCAAFSESFFLAGASAACSAAVSFTVFLPLSGGSMLSFASG